MDKSDDFLVEIGTEELPPKSLQLLSTSFANNIEEGLLKTKLSFEKIHSIVTPRRLAVYVEKVASSQQDIFIEKMGPSLAAAYVEGKPTPAALGFAKACKVPFDALTTKKTPKGECLYYQETLPGKPFNELAPALIKTALHQLPIAKPMFWGNHLEPFIRPVHWVVMLYGNHVIPCNFFDQKASNETYGHRFHHPHKMTITHPGNFLTLLKAKGFVLGDYQERKDKIHQDVESLAKNFGQLVYDEVLLNEVTGLVEWPVSLIGKFDSRFLKIPQEVLILAMKTHQKCFSIIDKNAALLPYFITVTNIESKNPQEVIKGNERVIHARLSDAKFFYHNDLKQGIESHLMQLKTIVFQNKLGTLYEKANRIATLAGIIAKELNADVLKAQRAGLLCKADLTTQMVGEFPELQGIMGYYYSIQNNESPDVSVAIKEHYLPKFSGDTLPSSTIASAVALADKIDTLVGIFGIKQAPTGEKDPFALRRAALGVIRILIENNIALDLKSLLLEAVKGYNYLENQAVVEETLLFIMERLRAWYLEKDITSDVFAAVYARYPTSPLDFDKRVKAVQYFLNLPQSDALTAANKRVSNILKSTALPPHSNYNYTLLELPAEIRLADVIEKEIKNIQLLCNNKDYEKALSLLATLKEPIDFFFDEVMVMTDNEALKNNRLMLLNHLRGLFLEIADISLLQK